jgi:hypothetical protein
MPGRISVDWVAGWRGIRIEGAQSYEKCAVLQQNALRQSDVNGQQLFFSIALNILWMY